MQCDQIIRFQVTSSAYSVITGLLFETKKSYCQNPNVTENMKSSQSDTIRMSLPLFYEQFLNLFTIKISAGRYLTCDCTIKIQRRRPL